MTAESRTSLAREAAFRMLCRPEAQRPRDLRRRMAQGLPVGERPLFFELVAGITRRRVTLDLLIATCAKAPLSRIEKKVLAVMRLAAYQWLYLKGIPDHAALGATLPLLRSRRARGFANAILRTLMREGRLGEGPAPDEPQRVLPLEDGRWFLCGRPILPEPAESPLLHAAGSHGFSEEAALLLGEELGVDRARDLMAQANERPQSVVRLLKGSSIQETCPNLVTEPLGEGELKLHGLPKGVDPGGLAAFVSGDITVQGPFAARVAPLLAPWPDARVLDLCAPPGGKTIHLAERWPTESLFAHAEDRSGWERLQQTLGRCGHQGVTCLGPGGDPFSAGPFDALLLDVPCSNTGVLKRRPEARHRLTRKSLSSLLRLQRSLLARGLAHLMEAPGRKALVYATCSVLPAENEGLVRQVLKDFPEFTLAEEITSWPFGPWQDGGFAVRLERSC